MSGGHYEYVQFRFTALVEQLEEDIKEVQEALSNPQQDTFFEVDKELLRDMQVAEKLSSILVDMIHELDYFMSGDTGIDSYRIRLNEKGIDSELIDKLQEVLKGEEIE